MKFKRFLALALSLLMVFGGAASIFAADDDATTEAEEVTAVSPYQAAIDALKVLGIFKGDDNGDSADKAVNRWQMALFVSRALTGEIDDAYWGKTAYDYSKFTDVTGTSSLYLGAIGFANQKGIILGYDDPATGKSIFNPDGGITYQDALTMATRTLGFTGLAYPWGVIEKAIDLELTKGLVDVGYQDELTRGEVAQIVYNMLIAKVLGADGKYWTLKDKAFGIEEAVVVIVAGDQVKYTLDNEVAKRDNYVSFQILGEDGKVTEPVYSISATAFGIDKDEDPDAYVGYSYSVATSNDFASFVSCEINPTVTYWNLGKTTKGTEFTATKFNEGKANESTKLVVVNPDDAKDTTDNYYIVEDYTTLRTIQGATTGVEKIPGDSELLVYDPSIGTTVVTNEGTGYYTDSLGNILKPETEWNKDLGKYVTTLKVLYYYNSFTKSYYTSTDNTYYNGYEWVYGYVPVSDEKVAEAKVGYKDATKYSFGQITGVGGVSNTYAYASLTLIDDYRAYEGYDRAIYKAYGLGQVILDEKDGDGNLRTKIKTPTGIVAEKVTVLDRKTSETALSDAPPTFVDAVTGKKLDTPKNGAWILYYYNAMTNTIEVLETLTVEKGTLTGWNIGDKTVTIGNEKFPANYDTLKNNGIGYTARTANGTTYTDDTIKVKNNSTLYSLYTRAVNYIVIDGDVVWIEANNSGGTTGVVVIHSFLGMTSDGSLEFYAYTTSNPGALRKITIGSIDNWYFGYYNNTYASSYSYLMNNATIKGAKYRIAAIDSDGVYYLTSTTGQGNTLTFDTYYRAVFNSTLTANGSDNVISITLSSDMFYVFTCGTQIFTAKGNPAVTLAITGNYYWASSKMIVAEVDADTFATLPTHFNSSTNFAYYYVPTYDTPTATTGVDSAGLATFTYNGLINIATGSTEDKTVSNQNLVKGKTYYAVDGVIVSEVTSNIWTTVKNAYTGSTATANTQLVYGGRFTVDYTPNVKNDDYIAAFRKLIIGSNNATPTGIMNATGGSKPTDIQYNIISTRTLSDSVRVRYLSKDSNAEIAIENLGSTDSLVKATLSDRTKKQTYTIDYFYNTSSGYVVAYIVDVEYYTEPATQYNVVVAEVTDGVSVYDSTEKVTVDVNANKATLTFDVATNYFGGTFISQVSTLLKKDASGAYSIPVDTSNYEISRVNNVITVTFKTSGLAVPLAAGDYAFGIVLTEPAGATDWTYTISDPIYFTIK